MKIPNIKLGFSKTKYTHNLSRDCNTTFPFGIVQPIFTQYMLPNSDIKVNAKQLVRLAPMPVPSFARVSLRTVTRFVPEMDVVPYSDAFYSRLPYKGKVFTQLPVVDNPTLLCYILNHSNYCIYEFNSSNNTYKPVQKGDGDLTPEIRRKYQALFVNKPNGVTLIPYISPISDNYVDSTNATALRPLPTPENADYVVFFDYPLGTHSGSATYCVCFNFGTRAKIFRNICIGLGYSLDLDDFTPVRLTPLLSYYKAYYDTFGLTRFKSFTATKCFHFITECITDVVGEANQTFTLTNAQYVDELFEFFDEVADSYYSSGQDFVSLHRDSFAPGASEFNYSYLADTNVDRSITVPKDSQPGYNIDESGDNLNFISLKALTTLTRFVNKNSILGKRLTDYMKLHFGSDKVSSIFQDSNFVDSSQLDCSINDVFSTSDTAQYDAATDTRSGENLGAFAGKGIGFGDLSFKYSAPCHGYLITLAAIVPDSGYFQGNSCDLFAVNWEQQPSADFDALGFEATPRSAFITHNNICNRSLLGSEDLTDKTFGFVPRFSGFKFAKNLVNGDMSRRGTLDSMSPYYLDHIIASQQIYAKVDKTEPDRFSLVMTGTAVPSSSYDWRYICKYPWLGNFLRLFVNDTGNLVKGSFLPSELDSKNYNFYCLDDPFICQCAFNVSVSNCLKPLSLSFDTFNEDTDNATKDVNPS